ncbi:hypothetical protein AB5J62_37395 [Amycolatopsis sp. cg5]|uniref:hypothetical protein n=1 Tax=Amycolatopsis sp. cg5 TaxID=3238802 RepID=UPI00352608DE
MTGLPGSPAEAGAPPPRPRADIRRAARDREHAARGPDAPALARRAMSGGRTAARAQNARTS